MPERREPTDWTAEETATVLAALMRGTPDAVVVADEDRRIHLFSPGAERIFGYAAEEVVGAPLEVLLPPDSRESHAAHVARFGAAECGARMMQERGSVRGRRADGSEFPAEASITRLRLEGRLHFAAVLRDITSRRRREEQLRWSLEEVRRKSLRLESLEREARAARDEARRERARLWAAIEALPHAFAVYDGQDRLVARNRRYDRLYRETEDAHRPGARFEDLLRAGLSRGQFPEAEGREEEWLADRLALRRCADGRPVMERLPGGRAVMVHDVRVGSGDMVSSRVDVTEIERQQRQLRRYAAELEEAKAAIERQALLDPLTGAANRRALDRRLDAIRRDAAGRPGSAGMIALLHIDIDWFKHVNDTLGHAAGDHVLREVARALQEETRAEDLVARVGGDEFIVLVEDACGREPMDRLGARLVRRLCRPIRYQGRMCRVGASVGVATAPIAGLDPDELLNNADVALYRAKRSGRARARIFCDEMRAELRRNKEMADDILRGLDRGEFEPHFQPQFDAAGGGLIGVEALVRWRHPRLGLLKPTDFLPIMRELSATDQLDQLILERSLADCRALEEEGLDLPRLSVNVALEKLNDPGFPARLDELRRPRAGLVFELAGSMIPDEGDDRLDWMLDALREREVELELDAFGSGRASILALLRIRFSRLKIDKEIVQPIVEAPKRRRLVRSIVDIARAVGIGVTAGGVATAEHARLLAELGCSVLQGDHLARPMDSGGLRAFLRARRDAERSAAG